MMLSSMSTGTASESSYATLSLLTPHTSSAPWTRPWRHRIVLQSSPSSAPSSIPCSPLCVPVDAIELADVVEPTDDAAIASDDDDSNTETVSLSMNLPTGIAVAACVPASGAANLHSQTPHHYHPTGSSKTQAPLTILPAIASNWNCNEDTARPSPRPATQTAAVRKAFQMALYPQLLLQCYHRHESAAHQQHPPLLLHLRLRVSFPLPCSPPSSPQQTPNQQLTRNHIQHTSRPLPLHRHHHNTNGQHMRNLNQQPCLFLPMLAKHMYQRKGILCYLRVQIRRRVDGSASYDF